MCDICRQCPCPSGCPNAPEPKAVFVCSGCDRDIYEGEDVYHIMGEQFCERCIQNAKEAAIYEYDQDDDEIEFDL